MSITFDVDSVEAANALPATRTLREQMGSVLAHGGDPEMRVLVTESPSLLSAVHHAFAEHRPLVISPDAMWLTVAQGVAQHVRLHAEQLRSRLVRHTGRARIEAEVLELDLARPEHVAASIEALQRALTSAIGEGRGRLFACDFTTSTDVERTAGEIVLLDAYSPYCEYFVSTVCGIPAITVTGVADDWRSILARLDVVDELDLTWWTRSLRPIVEHFVRAAEGQPSREFFQRIYKPQAAYGWDRITGWAARLHPYVGGPRYDQRNPLLEYALHEKLPGEGATDRWYSGPGVQLDEIPASASSVRVHVVPLDGLNVEIELEGGVLTVEVDGAGRLVPRAAWAAKPVTVPAMADIIDRIRAAGDWSAPEQPDAEAAGTAEMIELANAIESASLFDGALALPPPRERCPIRIPVCEPDVAAYATEWIRLGDGTVLAFCHEANRSWIRLRAECLSVADKPEPRWITTERASAIPIVGTTLRSILAAALDVRGIPEMRSLGTLFDALPEYLRVPPPTRPRRR